MVLGFFLILQVEPWDNVLLCDDNQYWVLLVCLGVGERVSVHDGDACTRSRVLWGETCGWRKGLCGRRLSFVGEHGWWTTLLVGEGRDGCKHRSGGGCRLTNNSD